jgi:ribosome-associated translation inhibitor RaiA
MQIQVNTDDNVAGREELARRVETEVLSALRRFSGHITRVEVHLSDENAEKGGANDKRCLMEARPKGLKPLAVSHQGATLEEAFTGAAKKLQAALESMLGRSNDHKGGASIRTSTVLRDGD